MVLGPLSLLWRLVLHSHLRMLSLRWHLDTNSFPETVLSRLRYIRTWKHGGAGLSGCCRTVLGRWFRFGASAPDLHLSWGVSLLREGGGGSSPPRSPRLQEVPHPLSGGTSFFSKCQLRLGGCPFRVDDWPCLVGAVLLPVGHGVGLLALGHGLLCPLLVGPPSFEEVGHSRRPSR